MSKKSNESPIPRDPNQMSNPLQKEKFQKEEARQRLLARIDKLTEGAEGLLISLHILQGETLNHHFERVDFKDGDLLTCAGEFERVCIETLKRGPSGQTRL